MIATDEAGYGPKLGPMVVVGTGWIVSGADKSDFSASFVPYRAKAAAGDCRIAIDDSKAVFKSGMSLEPLRCLAAHLAHQCGWNVDHLDAFLTTIDSVDWWDARRSPWLAHQPLPHQQKTSNAPPAWRAAQGDELANAWATAPAQLCAAEAKIIPASRFNQAIAGGINKADLLGETTMTVVRRLLDDAAIDRDDPAKKETVHVFCDRHGGRRYYAGLLQNHFPGPPPVIDIETKSLSRYRIEHAGRNVSIEFTVKGDRFTPVAYSSMIAKWIREELMARLNQYFASRMSGRSSLKPTAGYPVDADRFLAAIKRLRKKESIDDVDLVRCR